MNNEKIRKKMSIGKRIMVMEIEESKVKWNGNGNAKQNRIEYKRMGWNGMEQNIEWQLQMEKEQHQTFCITNRKRRI